MRPLWYRVLHCEDGLIATGTAIALAAGAMVIGAGATAYSAHQERQAAEHAADAQKEISAKQIQATKDAELLAQQTAQDKLKLAQARKSKTILTAPTLETIDANSNTKSAMGV